MQTVAATSGNTNIRFKLPVKREKDKEQIWSGRMAEALCPDVGAERDQEPPNDDSFESFTKIIFRSFMFQRLTIQISKRQISIGRIPKSVLEMFLEERWTSEIRDIGKVIAEFTDAIDKEYDDALARIAKSLGVTAETAYDKFALVARKLFQDGINWGRIVALWSFGYEIVTSVMIKEDTDFIDIKIFSQKIDTLVDAFLREECAVGWIKDHGGWVAIIGIRLDLPKKIDLNEWLERFIIVGGTIIVGIFLFVLKIKPE
eukprot:Seg1055.6 transcript_id=Seg1055.6/GoldUCD/mRNA.D3Y31 product="Bcl-2-like antagonist/killer" protein_id=Seg1055.6/GoldUCD/D3Y31